MSKTVKTISGEFDEPKYRRLSNAYEAAVKAEKSEFEFEGKMLLTSFAKYLLEFLKMTFK